LVVVLAGYPAEMATLVAANPGMRSRFPKTIHFPDYDDDELVAIVDAIGAGSRYRLDEPARAAVRAWFAAHPRGTGFGNGRLSRNLFEAMVANQATRLVATRAPTVDQLTTLTVADLPAPAAPAAPERTATDGGHRP
jgi:hypothetical protein